jgi:hypothetical protein
MVFPCFFPDNWRSPLATYNLSRFFPELLERIRVIVAPQLGIPGCNGFFSVPQIGLTHTDSDAKKEKI